MYDREGVFLFSIDHPYFVQLEATLVSTIQTDWVAEFKPTMVSSGKVQTRQLKLCS